MNSRENLHDDDLTILSKPRDYICPCGKSYLSYAALFTHIKQKHNGKVSLFLCRHPARLPSHLPNMRKEVDLQSNPEMSPHPRLSPTKPTRTSTLRKHPINRKGGKPWLKKS